MNPLHWLARPLLAAIFIAGGYDALRNPEPRAKLAQPVLERMGPVAESVPLVPSDPVGLVRANAGLQLVAGGMLALGLMPRLAALALAASIVPTTAGGHRFWELDEPASRAQQRTHFLKNAAILGGLLVEAFS